MDTTALLPRPEELTVAERARAFPKTAARGLTFAELRVAAARRPATTTAGAEMVWANILLVCLTKRAAAVVGSLLLNWKERCAFRDVGFEFPGTGMGLSGEGERKTGDVTLSRRPGHSTWFATSVRDHLHSCVAWNERGLSSKGAALSPPCLPSWERQRLKRV